MTAALLTHEYQAGQSRRRSRAPSTCVTYTSGRYSSKGDILPMSSVIQNFCLALTHIHPSMPRSNSPLRMIIYVALLKDRWFSHYVVEMTRTKLHTNSTLYILSVPDQLHERF